MLCSNALRCMLATLLYSLYFAPFDSRGGLLVWLFGGGIGTNIGASIIWGLIAGFIGYFIARAVRQAWVQLHNRIDELHVRHDAHRDHLNRIETTLDEILHVNDSKEHDE